MRLEAGERDKDQPSQKDGERQEKQRREPERDTDGGETETEKFGERLR